ncbi:hypothetical protein RQP46_000041 [Phenoliferia psychrophenolica]
MTPQEKRRLTAKLDLRVMPIFIILYFVNLLDRIAVGSAAGYGLRKDLGITGTGYNIGISIFYIAYCAAEIPSNLLLKKIGAKTSYIHTGSQFIGVRVLLGLFEAELPMRMGLFIAAAGISTGAGAMLSTTYYGVGRITNEVTGWRNIFFITIITFGIAILSYFVIPHPPERCTMLTLKERKYILDRNKEATAGQATEERTKMHLVWRAFKNPSVWFTVWPWFVAQVLASSLSYFLPELLLEFGYSGREAQIHAGAPWFLAAGMSIIFGYLSHRTRHHFGFVLGCIGSGIFGFGLFGYAKDTQVRYAGLFFCATTVFVLKTAWCASNLAPYTTRATGTALSIAIGSSGGIVGAWVFIAAQAPTYYTGKAVTMTLLSFSFAMTIVHYYYCKWENKQRDLGRRDHRLVGLTEEEASVLGNLHPSFRLVT